MTGNWRNYGAFVNVYCQDVVVNSIGIEAVIGRYHKNVQGFYSTLVSIHTGMQQGMYVCILPLNPITIVCNRMHSHPLEILSRLCYAFR